MTTIWRRVSLGLFTLVGAFLIAFGILYASVDNMLWFHAAAVPEPVRDVVKPLYFALMQLIGGAAGALGLLGLYVTWGPMRRGVPLAATMVTLSYAVAFIVAGVTATVLARQTGAPVAWYNMAILLTLTVLGLAAEALARRAGARTPPAT